MKYMRALKHTLDFEDENITEFTKIKKNGTSKSYMKSQRIIYTKTIRKMHTDFVASRDNILGSLSTFLRYKPLYITLPSEREKESCLCIKCQNFHLLLQGINTYRCTQNLSKHYSVTEFLNSEPRMTSYNFPECNDTKKISNFIFSGKYIQLDCSENLVLKPKHEVQDAHFSGKKYSLHCSIVEPV